jgi:hypothetical protein
MWIALQAMIQELFQCRLNAMAPTAAHQRYALALPHQQNAFRALANDNGTDNDSVKTVATQVAALTYQSQLTALTAANSSQRHKLQLAHLASQQNLVHENIYQLIAALNAVAFNVSNKGRSVGRFGTHGNYGGGYGGRSCKRGCPGPRGRRFLPTSMYGSFPSPGRYAGGRFPEFIPQGPPAPPPCLPPGPQPYHVPGLPRMPPPSFGPVPFVAPQMHQHQQLFSNTVECHTNWNMC